MTPRQETTSLSWDGWLRLAVIGYFLGGVIGLWSLWLAESLLPGHIKRSQAILLCALYLPALCIGAGLWHASRGGFRKLLTPPQATAHYRYPHLVPILVALGAFGAWAGSYYISGLLVASQPMATLFTAIDRAIPLVPESAYIYVTVQWFVILAITLAGDVLPWRKIAAAYAANVAICALCFLFFPVTMHHEPIPVTDLSTWVMAVLRSADVANNCFPSSHCSMALLSAHLLYRRRRWWGVLGFLSALSIGVTTLTTKQHYLADVVAGFALAGLSYVVLSKSHEDQPERFTKRSTQL